MPFGMSLASDPAFTPALYDPKAEKGKRWSSAGFEASKIARLYHSSALLLPDASILVAGSNPNVDVNLTTVFPTEYRAEIFYPSYFSASNRPEPSGIPSKLSYGGDMFDVTIPASSYSGSANDAADNTQVVLIRGGWTTHGMNMGQRFLQLKNTYTVNQDGSIVLHVSQLPPVPEIFQPGPTMVFVVVNGIPSHASWAIIGSGKIEAQPKAEESKLPANVRLDGAKGSGSSTGNQNNNNSNDNGASRNVGAIVGGILGAIAVIGLLGTLIGIFLTRRRRRAANLQPAPSYAVGGARSPTADVRQVRHSDSSAFLPLTQDNRSIASLSQYYHDGGIASPRHSTFAVNENGRSTEFDPYASFGTSAGAAHRY
jgi:hypothetical protein